MPFRTATDKVENKAAPQTYRSSGGDRNSGLSLTNLITGRRPVNTTTDVARGGYRGLYDGIRGLADLSATVFGTDPFGVNRKIGDAMVESLRAKHPVVAEAIHPQYQPQTTAGKYTRALASFLPNAIGGEATIPARVARVAVPALLSEAAGQATEGTPLEGPARFVGGLAGGVAAGTRAEQLKALFTPKPGSFAPATTILTQAEQKGARALVPQNGRAQAVGQIQSQAERYRNAGINPTLADLTSDSARGLTRSLASRGTPARDAVRNFADARAANLPDRVATQATNIIGRARPLDDVTNDITARQRAAANSQYAEPYASPVEVTPEVHSALQGPEGASAIARAKAAASSRRDFDMVKQLDDLEAAVQYQFPARTTGAALDRVQIALGQKGQALSSGLSQKRDIASGYFGRQADVNSALDGVPHLADARANYAGFEQQKAAAEAGANFLLPRSADEFATALRDASPDSLAAARATASRAVQMAAGESTAAAPGVARRLSLAPEQMTRNEALLGPVDAATLQNNMGLEAQAVRNAQDINPRAGSQTSLNQQDTARGFGEVATMGKHMLTGNIGGTLLGGAKLYLKSLGLNDLEAEATANMAIDPAKTDAVAAYLQSQIGPTATQQFLNAVRAGAQNAGPAVVMSGALANAQGQ